MASKPPETKSRTFYFEVLNGCITIVQICVCANPNQMKKSQKYAWFTESHLSALLSQMRDVILASSLYYGNAVKDTIQDELQITLGADNDSFYVKYKLRKRSSKLFLVIKSPVQPSRPQTSSSCKVYSGGGYKNFSLSPHILVITTRQAKHNNTKPESVALSTIATRTTSPISRYFTSASQETLTNSAVKKIEHLRGIVKKIETHQTTEGNECDQRPLIAQTAQIAKADPSPSVVLPQDPCTSRESGLGESLLASVRDICASRDSGIGESNTDSTRESCASRDSTMPECNEKTGQDDCDLRNSGLGLNIQGSLRERCAKRKKMKKARHDKDTSKPEVTKNDKTKCTPEIITCTERSEHAHLARKTGTTNDLAASSSSAGTCLSSAITCTSTVSTCKNATITCQPTGNSSSSSAITCTSTVSTCQNITVTCQPTGKSSSSSAIACTSTVSTCQNTTVTCLPGTSRKRQWMESASNANNAASLATDEDDADFKPNVVAHRRKRRKKGAHQSASNKANKKANNEAFQEKSCVGQESGCGQDGEVLSGKATGASAAIAHDQGDDLQQVNFPEHANTDSVANCSGSSRVDVITIPDVKPDFTTVREVADLTADHIEYLVNDMKQQLKQIFKGKTYCRRHEDYKSGGRTRGDLAFQVRFGLFSEEQIEAVMCTLTSIFSSRTTKYLDYVTKVLLPETFVLIYTKIFGGTRDEAELLLIDGAPSTSQTFTDDSMTE